MTQKIDISSTTIFRVLVIGISVWFLFIIRDILLMLLAAVVIASGIEPLAKRLQRYKVPRALSITIVYVLVLGLLGGILSLVLPPLTSQVGNLAASLPEVAAEVQDKLNLGQQAPEQTVQQLQEGVKRFGENLTNFSANIFRQTRNIFTGIFSLLFVFVIAFYLVIEEDALKKLFRFVVPRAHLRYMESVVDRSQHKIGRWTLAQLFLAVVVGVAVGTGLWAMGVPYALVLGLLAGVMEIVPVIGPIMAGIIGTAVALSQSFLLGVGALAFYIVVQQVENHVLIPNVMRRATGLNPLVTLIAILLGGRLAGVAGIILAVPVATIIGLLLSDFFATTPAEEA